MLKYVKTINQILHDLDLYRVSEVSILDHIWSQWDMR